MGPIVDERLGNYYYWYRARKDFNGERVLFWASGLSMLEKRGKIENAPVQGKVLRVKYPSGKYGSKDSGVAFPWIFQGKYDELTLTYRVRLGRVPVYNLWKIAGVVRRNR